MANLKEIKRRIKSVKNTRQITKAMQLVASSKMKRAQDAAIAGVPYALFIADLLSSLEHYHESFEHPLFEAREVKKHGVLVLATDRGLCGPLNSNLFRYLSKNHDKATTRYVAVGRKAVQYLSRSQRDLMADFEVDEQVNFRQIRVIGEFLVDQFLKKEIDSVSVVYPRFVNTLIQEPAEVPILPFAGLGDFLARMEELRKKDSNIPEAPPSDDREMKFEPSIQEILAELPELFLKQELYQMMLSTRASENSARMVAMKSATDNASNLIDDLTLDYNKARQAAITQEVLEIAASAASVQN